MARRYAFAFKQLRSFDRRLSRKRTGIERESKCEPAIVTAATLYVVRCMVKDTLPLNAGVLRRLEIRVPEGILCPPAIEPPEDRAAVAAGNVETSQRIVDCLLGAFGVAGASQGTMNNFLFGDSSFGYYETICGGAGATADAQGLRQCIRI